MLCCSDNYDSWEGVISIVMVQTMINMMRMMIVVLKMLIITIIIISSGDGDNLLLVLEKLVYR